jgi:hypothetical protein
MGSMPKSRYWAMRTSRNTDQHRSFIRDELFGRGFLRQGWGYTDEQDLRIIAKLWSEKSWEKTSEKQREAWHHWRMLLGEAPEQVRHDSMNVGDLVLVPNMPTEGRFTLCEITGPYQFNLSADPRAGGDLGHALPVKILTPREGVSNASKLVMGGLQRSMKSRGRMWSLDAHAEVIESIIQVADSPQGKDLLIGTDPEQRVEEMLEILFEEPSKGPLAPIIDNLQKEFSNESWEHILRAALEPLVRESDVLHTGGRNEQGADVLIRFANPFDQDTPFVVAIQVKDWTGVAGERITEQLKRVVYSYDGSAREKTKPGILVCIYVALTRAEASPQLVEQCKTIEVDHHIPVRIIAKDDLMGVTLRGLLKR